jgi:hypothetical protein
MSTRLPDRLTKVTQEEMFAAIGHAFTAYMGGPPTKEKICLLVAQSAFETGWWQFMHCFNVGNAKSVEGDGCDFTYFRCWEVVPVENAKVMQAHPAFGHLVSIQSVDAKGRATIWLTPDHPGCRFRAFESLEVGVYDYFKKMVEKYSDEDPEKNAWGAIVRADPVAFVHALKKKGYFTGDETIYTNQVSSIFKMLCKKPFDMAPFAPPEVDEDAEARNARILGTNLALEELRESDKNS